MSFTIGSLFDGSGGFPLAASTCGGVPVWAAEIEPYPIAVTTSRFPTMKHLGSVTDIKGNEIEPVDIITFGSPCQDLSIAGKRAGLKHEDNGDDETTRSGLFMEAVRIIKEMREATNGKYPTFALWENVPGAFSSNKGEDFRVVLEELIKIVEPTATMPPVPKNGWPYADSYCGDGWSIAYRTFDAQYWGVPQRRRRIYLVADFGGERAGEISFEREGVRGNFTTFRTAGESTAGDAENCSGATDCECFGINGDVAGTLDASYFKGCGMRQGTEREVVAVPYTLKIRSGVAVDSAGKAAGKGALIQTDKAATLAAAQDQYLFQPIAVATQQGGAEITENGVCPTITAAAGMSGNNQPWVAYPNDLVLDDQGGSQISVREDGKAPTIRAEMHGNVPCVMDAVGFDMYNQQSTGDVSRTIKTPVGGDDLPVVCYSIENHPADSRVNIDDSGKVQTLTGRMGTGGGNVPMVMEPICCIDGDKIGKAERAGGSGLGVREGDKMYTLTAKDAGNHAVAYAMQGFGDYKDATDLVVDVAGVDCRNMTEYPELYPTLQAKPNGGQSLNFSGAVRVQYIVRRLTPTECARLQGFPDDWGHPDKKDAFTDEEYLFWLNVRNTHAEINGKAVKEYTKEQMLTWYNKLHTDSSEYKMWGNGIALPCVVYIMQGIADALK